jgi:hypothetical protein
VFHVFVSGTLFGLPAEVFPRGGHGVHRTPLAPSCDRHAGGYNWGVKGLNRAR